MPPLSFREIHVPQAIDADLAADIERLETANMVPILAAAGIAPDPARLRSGLAKPQEVLAGYRDGRLVCLLRWTFRERKTAQIWSIQIAEPGRNRTLLLPLLRRADALFRAAGVERIRSVALLTNVDSVRLHERLGFRRLAEGPMGHDYEAVYLPLSPGRRSMLASGKVEEDS
jgi:hypothetical protein